MLWGIDGEDLVAIRHVRNGHQSVVQSDAREKFFNQNKFKEVQKDNYNSTLLKEKVCIGHIASLMHFLFLVFR